MNYSTNYNLNKPERNEQYNLDHWNDNTDAIDTAMHTNAVNISANATNIQTILTGLSTKNVSDANSVYFKLMKLIYPVGSIYWSSNSANPSTLFGGTWTQIKDKFVLAKGDTYSTVGATGGSATVTLTVNNLPSHDHSFTPSGTVSSHSHTLNNGNTSSSGTKTTAGFRGISSSGMSGNSTGSFSIRPSYYEIVDSASGAVSIAQGTTSKDIHSVQNSQAKERIISFNIAHTHTSKGYLYGSTDSTQPTFTGTAGTTGTKGSGTAFSIMPPYVVKYCWERTA